MKKMILLWTAIAISATAAAAQDAPKNALEKPARHEFVMTSFKTESGVVLPRAVVVYGTYGKLNAAKDNVVLLPLRFVKMTGGKWVVIEK